MKQQDFYAAMAARYAALTGAAPDEASDLGLRFQTLAESLSALSERIDAANLQLFAATATGETLDAHALTRGLTRKGAVHATGLITVTRPVTTAVLTIPVGTLCAAADGTEYETTAIGTMAIGAATTEIPARAVRAGASGNAAAGAITLLLSPSLPISLIHNAATFSGGCDTETDQKLRARILADCANPESGANTAYYEKLAMAQEGVSSAVAVAGAAGTVTVHAAADGKDVLPSAALTALQTLLDEKRAVGFTVTARAAQAIPTAISAGIAVNGDFNKAKAAIEAMFSAELGSYTIGRSLTRARLGQLLMDSGFVRNYSLTQPAADVAADPIKMIRAGTITLQQMEG